MSTLAGRETFPSFSSLIGCVLSICRERMDGPNPSEMEIKVLIPVPIFYKQINVPSIFGEKKKNFNRKTEKFIILATSMEKM